MRHPLVAGSSAPGDEFWDVTIRDSGREAAGAMTAETPQLRVSVTETSSARPGGVAERRVMGARARDLVLGQGRRGTSYDAPSRWSEQRAGEGGNEGKVSPPW